MTSVHFPVPSITVSWLLVQSKAGSPLAETGNFDDRMRRKMGRTGIGYDLHRLASDRRLVLGGVEIPYIKGLEGYSDADVLLHALCDALLGAAGEGDIGEHFPTNDPVYKDISSLELLKKVASLVTQKGFSIDSVDATVVAEEPNLSPFKQKMADTIARTLGLDPGRVNVKATTTEGLGSIGRGEAISSFAIVSLK